MGTLQRGLKSGFQTTWELGKIIFPITLAVTILRYTPVLEWLIHFIAPVMKWLGLSGEAAIPLVLGNFLNLYAGIGAILTLDLSVKEVFILAVMLSFSHNLLIESSVAARVGVKLWVMFAVRIGLAFISAIVINLVWQGGSEQAAYGFISQSSETVNGWGAIILQGLRKSIIRSASASTHCHSAHDFYSSDERFFMATYFFTLDGTGDTESWNEGEHVNYACSGPDFWSCLWVWRYDSSSERGRSGKERPIFSVYFSCSVSCCN